MKNLQRDLGKREEPGVATVMDVQSVPREIAMRGVLLFTLGWIVYPLWLLAGLGDQWCHRRTAIAVTSGTPESLMHLAQLATVGLAVLAALFLEPSTAVFVLLALLIASHSVLSFIDIAYTQPRRHISPIEQHIHAYMEVLPWTSLALFAALYPGMFTSTSWNVQLKAEPPPAGVLLGVIVPAVLLAVVPAILEFFNTRHGRRTSPSRPYSHTAPAQS